MQKNSVDRLSFSRFYCFLSDVIANPIKIVEIYKNMSNNVERIILQVMPKKHIFCGEFRKVFIILSSKSDIFHSAEFGYNIMIFSQL